jgi:hypothetical protein
MVVARVGGVDGMGGGVGGTAFESVKANVLI